jgi:hypothetical protein
MPQNIVVGDEAEAVAQFVADHAGTEVERPSRPNTSGSSTTTTSPTP